MNEDDDTENNFPNRIISLLEDEEMQSVIHWLPDGLAFAIKKPEEFEELVLKRHFNSIKFGSFLVRLRKWGFKRIDEKMNGRYHTFTFRSGLFRRDQPHLCKQMTLQSSRMKAKKSKPKTTPESKLKSKPKTIGSTAQVLPPMPNYFYGMNMNQMMMSPWQNMYWQNNPFPVASASPQQLKREAGLTAPEAATVCSPHHNQAMMQQNMYIQQPQQQQQQQPQFQQECPFPLPKKKCGKNKSATAYKKTPSNKNNQDKQSLQVNVQVRQSQNDQTQQVQVNFQVHQSLKSGDTSPSSSKFKSEGGTGSRDSSNWTLPHHSASMPKLKSSTPPDEGREVIDRRKFNRMHSEPVLPSFARERADYEECRAAQSEEILEKPSPSKQEIYRKSISYDQDFLDPFSVQEAVSFPGASGARDSDWDKVRSAISERNDAAMYPYIGTPPVLDKSAARFRSQTDPTFNRNRNIGMANVSSARKFDPNEPPSFNPINEPRMPQMISFPSISEHYNETHPEESVKASDLFHDSESDNNLLQQETMQQQFEEPIAYARHDSFLDGGIDPFTFDSSGESAKDSINASEGGLARQVTRIETPIKSIAKSTDVLGIPEEPMQQRQEVANAEYNAAVAATNSRLRHMKQYRFNAPPDDKPVEEGFTAPPEDKLTVEEGLHGGSLGTDAPEPDDVDLHSLLSITSRGAVHDELMDFVEKEMADNG